jgi:hypothetical protein
MTYNQEKYKEWFAKKYYGDPEWRKGRLDSSMEWRKLHPQAYNNYQRNYMRAMRAKKKLEMEIKTNEN